MLYCPTRRKAPFKDCLTGTPGRCGRAGVCPSDPMKSRPGLGGAMPRQPESGDGIGAPGRRQHPARRHRAGRFRTFRRSRGRHRLHRCRRRAVAPALRRGRRPDRDHVHAGGGRIHGRRPRRRPGSAPGVVCPGFVVVADADIEIIAAGPPAVAPPGIAVHRRTPARLDRHVAAGRLTAAEACAG